MWRTGVEWGVINIADAFDLSRFGGNFYLLWFNMNKRVKAVMGLLCVGNNLKMVIEITYLWRLTNNNIFAEFDGDNITLSWAQNDEK